MVVKIERRANPVTFVVVLGADAFEFSPSQFERFRDAVVDVQGLVREVSVMNFTLDREWTGR